MGKNRSWRYCIASRDILYSVRWNTGALASARNNAFITWASLLARGGVRPLYRLPPDGRRVAGRGRPPGKAPGGRMMDQGEVSPNRLLEKALGAIPRLRPTEGGRHVL